MDQLPDELLMMILDYLPSHVVCLIASQVCTRWERVADARAQLLDDERALRRWGAGRGPGARALLLTAPGPLPLPRLLAAAHLTELTVHLGLAFSSGELMALARLRLRHVDVFCRAEVLSTAALPLAARVRSLVINEPVASPLLADLAQGCRLKALHMYGRAGCFPREELLQLLESRRDRLEELTLRCHSLREEDYVAIGRCRALRSLQLYCCRELTPAAALQLVALPALRKLHLTGTCKWLDGAALHCVLARLPRGLTELVLSASRLRDEHAAALARRAARLRRVELWRTQLSARGLLRLAFALPLLQELDVDVAMPRTLLLALGQHPSLASVRCRLPQEKVESHLRLREAAQCHGGRLARPDGEGYRAQLFYYWMQDVPAQPAQPEQPALPALPAQPAQP